MPEKVCFPHLLGTDIDHIVPSLDMELDENSLIHMMDHDLTMDDSAKLRQIQDVLCEPLPMSPALGMQHSNNTNFQKYRSHSTGGDIHAEHLLFSPDETHTQSRFLQDLMQTGSNTDISGIIPIYDHPINGSTLIVNSPPTSQGYHTPQPQHTTYSSGSLLFAPSDDLLNIECSSALDSFPSQAVPTAGNSLIADNSDTQWAEQLINTLTSASNTASMFKVPGVPASNQFNNPGPRRISSWSHIEHEPEVEEPVPFSPQQYGSGQVCYNPSNNLMDNCSLTSPHQTASLPREDNSKSGKKSHRRTSSDTSLVQFFNAMYGPHNPQLVPSNETFNMPFAEQTQQQHSAHTANKHASGGTEHKRSFKRKQKKQLGTHPYPHCFHGTNYTTQTNGIHNGVHSTSSFSTLPYPTTSSSAYCTSSPKVLHSQSVPNSPSMQRAGEPSPSASSLRQKLGAPVPTTNSTSNFTFDNVMLTATPTHISASDLNSGTSQEARDEKEKTEAFSRLHQGLHLWEFLMEILLTNEYQPILKWTDKENGVFKIVDSEALARFWGEYRRKPKMNYDKMSRAIRYYYGKDILDKAPKRLYYQFKYHSHWWEKLQKVDASFKINHIPVSNIPAPNVQDLIIPDDL